jgi:cell division protein FtsW
MVAFLVGLGLVAIYASSSLKAAQDVGDPFFFFRKQAIAAAIGFGILAIIQFVPFKWIERATLPVILLTLFLLALVFIPGMYVKVKGAERWLNLPFIGGQPAELAKLAMVLFLAKNLSRESCRVDSFMKGILPNLLVFALFTVFLLRQRDLGTPVILFGLTMLMLYVAGLSHKLIGLAGIAGLGTVGLAIILEPFRVKRILSFLDPWSQVQDGGFQIIQSFLAFQNGGLLGVGLGESKQKLLFLPEAHTDFILPVIGEELGFLGIALVCAIFFFTIWLSYRIILLQSNPYRKFLAFGITAALAVQTLGNMGVTMGLLPTKGMPLPFISSGRSSLLVSLVMAALLIKLGRDVRLPRNVS